MKDIRARVVMEAVAGSTGLLARSVRCSCIGTVLLCCA